MNRDGRARRRHQSCTPAAAARAALATELGYGATRVLMEPATRVNMSTTWQQYPIIDQLEPTVTGYADGDP
jgi:hypothetical protein